MGDRILKLNVIFTQEQMGRCHVTNENELTIDVHGMTCAEATRLIRNVIAVIRGAFEINIIHGYNGGHAIKDMLRNTFLSTRVLNVKSVGWNPGMTHISVAG